MGIEDRPDVWIDAREFDRLLAAGHGDQALAVCRGELLSDLDDDWVLEERQAHRERMATLLGALGAAAEQAGDLDRAVGYARERLALDPLSEDAARVLIGGSRAPAIARAPSPCIEGFARAFGASCVSRPRRRPEPWSRRS